MKITPSSGAFSSMTSVTPAMPGDTPAKDKSVPPVVAASAPEPVNPERDPFRRDDLEQAVAQIKETGRIFNRQLEFEVTDNHRVVIRVLDSATRDVIREIPPETLMRALDRMEEALGLLLDRKV